MAVYLPAYTDIENCSIKLRAYASVQGYVHNGITGMYYVYNRAERQGQVT